MFKHFELFWEFKGTKYGLEFDRDYGIDKLTGWTFWADGSCMTKYKTPKGYIVSGLDPNPFRTVWQGVKNHRRYANDSEG